MKTLAHPNLFNSITKTAVVWGRNLPDLKTGLHLNKADPQKNHSVASVPEKDNKEVPSQFIHLFIFKS